MKQYLEQFSKLARLREFSNSNWFRVAQGLILFAALFLMVAVGILPPQYSLEAGEISPETIYAPRAVIDHGATSLARQLAAESVADRYRTNPAVADSIVNGTTELVHFLIDLERGDENRDEEDEEQENILVDELMDRFPEIASIETAEALLEIPMETLEHSAELIADIILVSMREGVTEDEVESQLQSITNQLFQAQIYPELLTVITHSLEENFRHNKEFSAEDTEAERRNVRDQVEEIRILKGAKIIDRGETVTDEQLSQLQALGLLHTSFAYDYYFGLAGLLFCVFAAWAYYLFKLQPEIFKNTSKLWLIGIIVLLTLGVAKLFNFYMNPLLIPASMATLLLTIIFNMNLALFFGTSLALIISIMVGSEMSIMVLTLIGSIVGAYSVTQVNQRSDLTRAGLFVAGTNAVVILALVFTGDGLALNPSSIQGTLIDMSLGVGSGILASVFAIGLLPFFEMAFGITTSVRLLELANPNQKPLKRLLLEAPGTYHHSILVGNLAEAAAEVVGADPVLARVGSYYHDLGKLTRPYFFIENQFQGSNPHDKIPPSLSSMILTSHVRAGTELATQYKLPPVIKDIIEQHHGDTLIGFFYHRALAERGNKDQLLEDKFRYEGPKPQFKEAGIIMLADSVEAAVRSLSQPNQFRIQSMVTKIVQDKLADGQLDECDLTLKDLNQISEAFVRVMTGIYHKRIAYPTEQDLRKLGS